jgi:hypothetical protein
MDVYPDDRHDSQLESKKVCAGCLEKSELQTRRGLEAEALVSSLDLRRKQFAAEGMLIMSRVEEQKDIMFMEASLDVKKNKMKGGRPVFEAPPPKKIIFCDDNELMLVAQSDLMHKVQEQMELSVSDIAAHQETCQKLLHLDTSWTSREPLKGLPQFESEMAASARVRHGDSTAQFTCMGNSQGAYVYGTPGGVCFVTHRHGIRDSGAYDNVYGVGAPVVGHFLVDTPMVGEENELIPRVGKITAIQAKAGQDVVYYFTDIVCPRLAAVMRRHAARPEVGRAVCQTTLVLADGKFSWETTMGKIVSHKGDSVFYDLTTRQGDCGYPIYCADGTVLACHLWGNVSGGTGTRTNGGELYGGRLALPKKGTYNVPPLDISGTPGEHQGRVLQQGKLKFMFSKNHQRMTEKFSFRGLRPDKDLRGIRPKHVWAKPSTAMNRMELGKFADELAYDLNHERLNKAVVAAILFDIMEPVTVPFCHPTEAGCHMAIESMDGKKSAGSTAGGRTANEYYKDLGEGDMVLGKQRVVERALRLYATMCNSEAPDADLELLALAHCWYVIGKKDGYKKKKLPCEGGSGRTIQCPCLELKILWIVCFGQSDQAWIDRGESQHASWVHQGEDADLPVHDEIVRALMSSKSVFAGDMSSFDRHMIEEIMTPFFLMYMDAVCPGAPRAFLEKLAVITIYGFLITSDGAMADKERGNPSGFMNTLRLNCVAHMIAMLYVVMKRMEEKYPDWTPLDAAVWMRENTFTQMCGDDSRIFALTAEADEFLDSEHDFAAYLKVWNEELPWVVTVEGAVRYTDSTTVEERIYSCPPMVSRRFAYVDGVLFEPLYNISRVLKRLISSEPRTELLEKDLITSAYSTAALQIYWMTRPDCAFFSLPLMTLIQQFPHVKSTAYDRAARMYREARDRQSVECRAWLSGASRCC